MICTLNKVLLLPSNLEQKEIRLMNLFTYTYYSYYYFYFGKKVEWEFVCMK